MIKKVDCDIFVTINKDLFNGDSFKMLGFELKNDINPEKRKIKSYNVYDVGKYEYERKFDTK